MHPRSAGSCCVPEALSASLCHSSHLVIVSQSVNLMVSSSGHVAYYLY